MATYTVDKISYGGNTYNLEGKNLKNLVDGSATGSLRGVGSTAESSSYTIGNYAFAEGNTTQASGNSSHAEGSSTVASAAYTHAEGYNTSASEQAAHAEGHSTQAYNSYAHAQNYYTKAAARAQTALGTYNIADTWSSTTHPSGTTAYGTYAVIVGNGTGTSARSNALTLDWTGNVKIALHSTENLYLAIDELGWTSEVID